MKEGKAGKAARRESPGVLGAPRPNLLLLAVSCRAGHRESMGKWPPPRESARVTCHHGARLCTH